MLEKLRFWIYELNLIPCDCGCRDDHWNVKDSLEGIICEAEIVCDQCGKVVNYWAYGNTEFPVTYTEAVQRKITTLKQKIFGKKDTFHARLP